MNHDSAPRPLFSHFLTSPRDQLESFATDMMDMQLFVGSGVFVFGIWALKTIITIQDVSEDEGCDSEYGDVVR